MELLDWEVHPHDFYLVERELFGLSEDICVRLLTQYKSITGKHQGETRRLRNTFLWQTKEKLQEVATLRLKLKSIAKSILDYSAQNKIHHVCEKGSDEDIKKLHQLLTSDVMRMAILIQSFTEQKVKILEKDILSKNPYSILVKVYPQIVAKAVNANSELAVRKIIRRFIKQSFSYINLSLGIIGKGGVSYASGFEVEMRNEQKAEWRAFGKNTKLTRGDKSVSLFKIMSEASHKRFSELYTLIKGIEQYVDEKNHGWNWAFITLTAPPEFHPNPSKGQRSWTGTTPIDAHQWITEGYRKVGKKLGKKNIQLCGLKVVEPHKDGCPHWHILVFNTIGNLEIIKDEFQKVPNWDSERGCRFEMNNGKASAASYVTKYIIKTISTIERLEGTQGAVSAWRSTWAIRAFAFLGMPKSELWRQLRRVKTCPSDKFLSQLWQAANGDETKGILANGKAFIELCGGLNIKQKDRPINVLIDNIGNYKIVTFQFRQAIKTISYKEQKWDKETNSY